MAEVLGPLNAKAYMKAPLAFKNFFQHLRVSMADVNAALAFKIYPTHTCFNGSRLGPLDAKRM
jgi:hypothetical protein